MSARSRREEAAAWALGAVDERERRAFEALMQSEPGIAREADEYACVAAMIALAAPPLPPPADLRGRIIGVAR